ncbi:BON domain-containing protein [Edwardsiella piscicida]|uniref:BON domain-containing protein n=1 Tax=Edwardsiella piscicida TaxID=1263550 RepID=UPI002908DF58|nr:BON domain-containing protein [Edwardsiella piscicida]
MKWSKQIQALGLAAVLAASLAGCAGSTTQESTGNYIDDTVVTTKVKSALLNAKSIKSTEISVETYKGRVQLSGFVSSRTDAQRAVEVARGVKGVRSVENDMRIK